MFTQPGLPAGRARPGRVCAPGTGPHSPGQFQGPGRAGEGRGSPHTVFQIMGGPGGRCCFLHLCPLPGVVKVQTGKRKSFLCQKGQKAKQGRGSPRREELWQPQSPGVQPPETRATPLPCRTVQEGPSAVWGCAGGVLYPLRLGRRGPPPSQVVQEGPSTVWGWAGGAHLPSLAAQEGTSTVLCCASSEQAPPPWELGSQTGFSHFQGHPEKQECQINSSPGISHQRHRCRSLTGSQRAEESGKGACSLPAPVLRSRRWLGGREAVRKQQGQPMWPLRYMLCVCLHM